MCDLLEVQIFLTMFIIKIYSMLETYNIKFRNIFFCAVFSASKGSVDLAYASLCR